MEFAATAQLIPDGMALMVGLGGRLGVLCSGAILDAGLRGIAVTHTADAIRRIRATEPRVVIVPLTLPREERDAITCAALDAASELVMLPAIVDIAHVAHAIARAVAMSERRRGSSRVAVR